MAKGGVRSIAFSGFDLQTGFDDIAGRGEVCGWHAGDGTSGEELQDTEFLGLRLAEVVALEMVILVSLLAHYC